MNAHNEIKPVCILMADDDAEDRMMTERALRKARLSNELRFVDDGRDLLDYLRREGRYADQPLDPRPGLILLDLNMPRMDGRAALREIRSDPNLRCIPVVVLTTSRDEEDVLRSYELGVNSYITKPVTFKGLVEALEVFGRYWLELVELPGEKSKV